MKTCTPLRRSKSLLKTSATQPPGECEDLASVAQPPGKCLGSVALCPIISDGLPLSVQCPFWKIRRSKKAIFLITAILIGLDGLIAIVFVVIAGEMGDIEGDPIRVPFPR